MSRNSDWSVMTDHNQQLSATASPQDFKQESPATSTTETESARILGLDSAYISIPDDAFSRYDDLNFGDLYNLGGQSQHAADFPAFFDTNSFDGSSSTSPPEASLNFDDTPSPVSYPQSVTASMLPPPVPTAASISIPANTPTPSQFRYSFNDSNRTSGFLARQQNSVAAGRSPQANNPPAPRLQRAASFPKNINDFPYNLDTLETDFTSNVHSLARTTISNPIPTEHENFPIGDTTVKRHRAVKPDNVGACWTSPLCPNNNNATDGSHPDPSTCGGECAPFLFADSPQDIKEVMPEDSPMGVVELKPKGRSKKRSESSARSTPSGRQFAKPGRSHRTSEVNTPEDVSPKNDEEDDEQKAAKGNRVPHNEVEKRYRDKLNIGYDDLRMVIPSLRPQVACKTDMEDTGKSNVSKGEILRTAKTYIENMQKREKKLQEQLAYYKNRANDLEADKKCQSCFVLQNYSRMTLAQPQYGRL